MLQVYIKQGCPFCKKVKEAAERLGITPEYKDIADDAVVAELIARGGKRQVPYLVDTDTGTEMYESDDIVAYLEGTTEQEK